MGLSHHPNPCRPCTLAYKILLTIFCIQFVCACTLDLTQLCNHSMCICASASGVTTITAFNLCVPAPWTSLSSATILCVSVHLSYYHGWLAHIPDPSHCGSVHAQVPNPAPCLLHATHSSHTNTSAAAERLCSKHWCQHCPGPWSQSPPSMPMLRRHLCG